MLNGFTETSPHAYASPSNELHYNESRARYIIEINNSCRNVRQFCSDVYCMGDKFLNHWRQSNGNPRALTLHSYISLTDVVKINEKNKSITIGPFYVRT